MFNFKYLTEEHFEGFKKYKYRAIDTSPLSNCVMHPFWNFLVKFLPNNIAPNLLTFIGFLCMLAEVFLVTYYDYYNIGLSTPNWVFTVCGLLHFIGYTLDGMDGKQARKIGVSGPLGELFDHGLDSYIVFLAPYCIFSIFGQGEFSLPIYRGYLLLLTITTIWYISHWEKYNTGVLYLPWTYDISMWVTTVVFMIAGVYGPEFYKIYVYQDYTFVQIFEIFLHTAAIINTVPMSLYNVYLSYQSKSGRMYTIIEAIRPLWPILTLSGVITWWALKSPTDIIQRDPRAFLVLYGTLFSNVSTRLVIAEMSEQRCELINTLFWPLLAAVYLAFSMPQMELAVLYSLLLVSLVAHIHYGISVVRQMCEHYKISCFKVTKTKT